MTFTVLHATSPGGAYVIVGTTTAPTFAFTTASPETVGKWTYEIAVSDGHDSVLSPASATVIVDRTPPVLSLLTVVSGERDERGGRVGHLYAGDGRPTLSTEASRVTCALPSGSLFPIGDTIVSCSRPIAPATRRPGTSPSGSSTTATRSACSRRRSRLRRRPRTPPIVGAPERGGRTAHGCEQRCLLGRLAAPAAAEGRSRLPRPRARGRLPPPRARRRRPDGDARRLTASIGRVADELARTVVTDAIAAHGIAAKITAAQSALASAQTTTAAGNYYAAIVYDATAWVLAEQAMKKLP